MSKPSVRPKRAAGAMSFTALVLLLALLTCSWALANAPNPKVRLAPIIESYPQNKLTPMFLVVMLEGVDAKADPPGVTAELKSPKGMEVVSAEPVTMSAQKGGARLVVKLTVKPGEGVHLGSNEVNGELIIKSGGQPDIVAPFLAELEIVGAEHEAKVAAPGMLAALTGKEPGRAQAETAKPEPEKQAGKAEEDTFTGRGVWAVLGLCLLGGLGLNLTPCVYPLIPITISFFGGRGEEGAKKTGLLANVLVYWAGLAATYTAMGAFVSLTGRMLGQALTSPLVTLFIAAVFLIMASSMFGWWEIRLPASLNRVAAANRKGFWGSLIMGLTVGILAAPCVGPFVVALMAHVAQVGSLAYGLSVFFVFSIGLGLPLAVLAFYSSSISRLPGAGGWMVWVRKFFGVVLVVMAAFVTRPLLGDEMFRWFVLTAGLLGGAYLGFMEKSGKGKFLVFKKIFGVSLMAAAALFWWFQGPAQSSGGVVEFEKFSVEALQKAKAEGKPVFIDIGADWCAPCKQMEAQTFPDIRVGLAMTEFVALKIDVTKGADKVSGPFLKEWGVQGVPTIIFLDGKGRWIRDATIVGFVPADRLLIRMKQVLEINKRL